MRLPGGQIKTIVIATHIVPRNVTCPFVNRLAVYLPLLQILLRRDTACIFGIGQITRDNHKTRAGAGKDVSNGQRT